MDCTRPPHGTTPGEVSRESEKEMQKTIRKYIFSSVTDVTRVTVENKLTIHSSFFECQRKCTKKSNHSV